jgi:hypothetical protein
MRQRQHVWVDGSLSDGEWFAKVLSLSLLLSLLPFPHLSPTLAQIFDDIRCRFPHYRIAIIYINAPEEIIRARIAKRSNETGRNIPESAILRSLRSPERSLQILAPKTDLVVRIWNGKTIILQAVEDHSGNWHRALGKHFGTIAEQPLKFPYSLGPLYLELTSFQGNMFRVANERTKEGILQLRTDSGKMEPLWFSLTSAETLTAYRYSKLNQFECIFTWTIDEQTLLTTNLVSPSAAAAVSPSAAVASVSAAAVSPSAAVASVSAAAVSPSAAAVSPSAAAVSPSAAAVSPSPAAVSPSAATGAVPRSEEDKSSTASAAATGASAGAVRVCKKRDFQSTFHRFCEEGMDLAFQLSFSSSASCAIAPKESCCRYLGDASILSDPTTIVLCAPNSASKSSWIDLLQRRINESASSPSTDTDEDNGNGNGNGNSGDEDEIHLTANNSSDQLNLTANATARAGASVRAGARAGAGAGGNGLHRSATTESVLSQQGYINLPPIQTERYEQLTLSPLHCQTSPILIKLFWYLATTLELTASPLCRVLGKTGTVLCCCPSFPLPCLPFPSLPFPSLLFSGSLLMD